MEIALIDSILASVSSLFSSIFQTSVDKKFIEADKVNKGRSQVMMNSSISRVLFVVGILGVAFLVFMLLKNDSKNG